MLVRGTAYLVVAPLLLDSDVIVLVSHICDILTRSLHNLVKSEIYF